MRVWLKTAREKAGLSMAALAKILGISESYYCMVENGQRQKTMDLTLAAMLSAALQIPIEQILELEQKKEAHP